MAEFKGRGFDVHYVEQGKGPAIVFAHGFVMDHTMFAAQFEDLPDHYRCIAWDMRGHGRSECPPGPWTMQDVVVDLIQFIEGTNAAPCHLVGMSWGGMAAIRVAIQREDLLRSLVLVDTSADAEPPETAELYRGYQQTVAEQGVTDELAEMTLPLFYGEKFRTASPQAMSIHVQRAREMPREAIVDGLDALLGRDSVVGRLSEIHVPTLVLHGSEDASVPIAEAEKLAHGIAGARLVRIPESGHTSPMEAPDVVNREMEAFVSAVTR